ncbi:multifunctional CCA addition/repair protein [Pseudaeromonas sp. ZJS20]|uniref:multifunctional CCA addition/repair protein n=1 Tax=Pseudaeromonas aegiceratis TaxID=3153928 RepID=UPI00390C954A
MEIYLVGGAVRDELLGLAVQERDYVVVGARAEELLDQGFTPVGRDFPVFLHPQTKEEYALARIERKQGHGYTGFACYAAPEVTLEEDLLRRDLTINAMARDEHGQLHDPYGGLADLQARRLRHVSPAFAEDPLRVLRVGRFAARFHELGFTVAPDTQALMQQMAASGELDHLTPERVWKELDKVLSGPHPQVFFAVLRDCGALKVLLPELDRLFGVPARPQWHPEIDTGVHALMAIAQAARLSQDTAVRFATVCHDFGKGLTPAHILPSHHGHGERGLPLIQAVCERFKVPTEHRELALLVSELHSLIHTALGLRSSTLLSLFHRVDGWRRPQRLYQLLDCCRADFHGRLGFEDRPYPEPDYVAAAFEAARAVPVQPIIAAGYRGEAIRQQLDRARLLAIREIKRQWNER